MHRRRLLAVVGLGSLAGCTETDLPASPTTATPTGDDTPTESPTGSETPTAPPENCPTTRELDVAWPRELDRGTAESFVESYENAYYREVVVDYEPESQLDSYQLAAYTDGARSHGDGWVVPVSGSGGVYRPTLRLHAKTETAPENADLVPVTAIEDTLVTELVREAADAGEAERHVDTPGTRVDRHVGLFASLSADFEPLSGPGEEDSLYVTVEDTTIELTAQATNFHGDYWWNARYYVDRRVVRRTDEKSVDPRDGELLECRRLD